MVVLQCPSSHHGVCSYIYFHYTYSHTHTHGIRPLCLCTMWTDGAIVDAAKIVKIITKTTLKRRWRLLLLLLRHHQRWVHKCTDALINSHSLTMMKNRTIYHSGTTTVSRSAYAHIEIATYVITGLSKFGYTSQRHCFAVAPREAATPYGIVTQH